MMFSYSKRLALLLTVCGTLLNSEPLFAPTDLSPAPKKPWYSRWASKLNPFGKKERTPAQYLKAVNKRMRTISNLTDEILAKTKRTDNSLQSIEKDLKFLGDTGQVSTTPLASIRRKTEKEKAAFEGKLAQYRKEWETLEKRLGNVYERLETDKQNLHDKSASAHFFKEVDRDLKDADSVIKQTKGRLRRAKETLKRWGSKVPGFRKKSSIDPALIEALDLDSSISKTTTAQKSPVSESHSSAGDLENPKGMSAASPEFLAEIEQQNEKQIALRKKRD